MSRWRAAAIHLALSAALATIVLLTMYGLWYPPPYFDLMGGGMLVVLIVGCDVVIGPLITLIIFRSGKKGLRFDLTVIGITQALALAYGLSMMFEVRPVFTVFAVDRFEIMTPADIKAESLAQASQPEYASFPLTGPRVVGARMPTDPKEKENLLFNKLGGDLSALPRFYVPYDDLAREAAARAKPLAALETKNPDARARIADAVSKLGVPAETLGYVPLVGAFKSMAMVLDRTTGRMLAVIDANPW